MKLEFTEQKLERRELYTENSAEFYRASSSSLQWSTDQHMHVRELHETRERSSHKD